MDDPWRGPDLAPSRESCVRLDAGVFSIAALRPGTYRDEVAATDYYLCVSLRGRVGPFSVETEQELSSPSPAESFAFLPAGRCRTVRATRFGDALHVTFTEALIDANPLFEPLRRGVTAHLHMFDRSLVGVAAIAHRQMIADPGPIRRHEIEPIVRTMLTRLVHCVEGCDEPRPERPGLVQSAIDHIDANLAAGLTLEEIATRCGASQYHFARSFREVMGTSVHQYVMARRCARAEHLLQETDEAIARVAYAVGFGSQSHMTTVMRRQLGQTPGQIRKRSRAGAV